MVHGLSTTTLRTRKCQWKLYLCFCRDTLYPPFPATVDSLLCFIAYLADRLQAASVPHYLSSLASLHAFYGYSSPPLSDPRIRLSLNGIRRIGARPPRQARAITLDDLSALALCLDSSVDSGYLAGYLLAFFGLLRKASIVPPTEAHFDPSLHLTRGDFSFYSWGMLVRVKRSKTRQFGDKPIFIPYIRTNGRLCPVSAVERHFSMQKRSPTDPALWCAAKPITHFSFVARLRSALDSAGRDPTAFSGHSFRRGGATFAARLGQPGDSIKILGDWSSDAYRRYIDCPLTQRTEIAKVLAAASI